MKLDYKTIEFLGAEIVDNCGEYFSDITVDQYGCTVDSLNVIMFELNDVIFYGVEEVTTSEIKFKFDLFDANTSDYFYNAFVEEDQRGNDARINEVFTTENEAVEYIKSLGGRTSDDVINEHINYLRSTYCEYLGEEIEFLYDDVKYIGLTPLEDIEKEYQRSHTLYMTFEHDNNIYIVDYQFLSDTDFDVIKRFKNIAIK